MDSLSISDKVFNSRLFLGTGKFASYIQMQDSIKASCTELATVALKRVDNTTPEENILNYFDDSLEQVSLLPNTSGAKTAEEAIMAAQFSRELFKTNWLKLEIHPNQNHLMPDALETLKAAECLVKEGFVVLPYIHADPVLCKQLEDVGVQAVMPLGATIGSNSGLETLHFLEIIIKYSNVPVIVDAGIGAPSQACKAMEIGADAVLVNTAIAQSHNPVLISKAFKRAVQAGRAAYLSGMSNDTKLPSSTSPLTQFLY